MADAHYFLVSAAGVQAPRSGKSNFQLDGTGDQLFTTFQCRVADVIDSVGIEVVAADGTSPTYDIRLETVGTDGEPSGTLATTSSNVLQQLANGFNIVTLDATHTCVRGEFWRSGSYIQVALLIAVIVFKLHMRRGAA